MPANAFAPEPRNAMLRPYQPTWKEQIAALLMGDTRPSPERRQFSQGIADILGYLPGTGNVLQGQEAAARGDTKGAMMAMLPLTPAARIPAQIEQQAVRQGIRAFHGSPHDFSAFDISKVGTGEGAQTFGHGLYFAEHEPVAQQYRDALSYPTYQGQKVNEIENPALQEAVIQIAHDIKIEGMTPQEAVKYNQESLLRQAQNAMQRFKESPPELADLRAESLRESIAAAKAARGVKPEDFAPNKGHMYEVSINARPEEFLDWDKPLKQQSPEVLAAFMKFSNAERKLKEYGNVPVGDLMKSGLMPHSFDITDPAFSKAYNEVGIKGIKYLDRGSRSAGEGTYNYVVYDDRLVEIMRKFGLIGAVGAGIAAKILARQDARREM